MINSRLSRYVLLSASLLLSSCGSEPGTAPTAQSNIRLSGELVAAQSHKVSPPTVNRLWQYTIKELAPESKLLNAGELVAAFDAQSIQDELRNKLPELKSAEQELANQLTQDEQRYEELKLELAQRKMEYQRDQRKAEIVDHSLSANDRRKAQIDFTIADNQYQLAQQRLEFHQQQRQAKAEILRAKIARLGSEVAQLQADIASMSISAPFTGIMVYVANHEGEKYSVSDTVQFGQPIAEVSQLDSLYVKAEIDEIHLKQLVAGMAVNISLDAYPERYFSGTLQSLGHALRNKSADNLSRVVDAIISLQQPDSTIMRPGMSVRLSIGTSQPAAAGQPQEAAL